jgi:hypothetical protein
MISTAIVMFYFMVLVGAAVAQTSSFTYQGRLTDGGTAGNGNYDLQFGLWDSLSGGTQIGSTQTISAVPVSNGVFTVSLDFGASSFNGANRFLEISARPTGGAAFTLLTPRQPVNSTPYAVRSLNATAADGLSSACAGCVQDTNINSVAAGKVSGTLPVGSVPAGSANYIQNSTAQQSADFNISGDGTAGGTLSGNVVNAVTQYNINGNRVLSIPGTNVFVGRSAGAVTTGNLNTFVGLSAGRANTAGSSNSIFGANAGIINDTGNDNSFFGFASGNANTSGAANSFFGYIAGKNNGTGPLNSFFGYQAGLSNTTEANNTFLGSTSNGVAGITNATAIGANSSVTQSNSLVLGSINGVNGATANTSVGIGTTAPAATLSVVGFQPPNINGATGTFATPVLQAIGGKGGTGGFGGNGSNIFLQGGDGGDGQGFQGGVGGSIYLLPGAAGSPSGTPGSVGIGTIQPNTTLDVAGTAFVRGTGSSIPSFNLNAADLQVGYSVASPGTVGSVARLALQPYGHLSGPWKFVTRDDASKAYLDLFYGGTGGITQDSSGNVGIGESVPSFKLQVTNPGLNGLRVATGTTGGTLASFGGFGVFQIDSNGTPAGRFIVDESGNVGIGATIPATKLQVKGDLRVGTSGTNGCVQRFDATPLAGACSSDVRFKRDITPFTNLLDKITQLRPVHYYWRTADYPEKHFGDSQSYGLVAQEVERVLPELVGQDEQGYKTVDYSKLPLMMLQAIKEQQQQIEQLKNEVRRLRDAQKRKR